MTKYLICIARGHGDVWEALCLDLDLAAQGESFEDVRSRLNSMIQSYVADASREGEPARSKLLSRRAPFHARLTWAWRLFVKALLDTNRDGDATVGFQIACRA
jgi:predicted RNase H-like HicB family nuclease